MNHAKADARERVQPLPLQGNGPWRHRVSPWPEIWRRRELVGLLAIRTLKIRYKNATLGFVWSLLGPLFLIVIYSVFLGILKVPIDLHILVVGIFAWHYLATCSGDSLHAVMGNANLVRKTAFPRLILPLSMVLANTVNFLLSGMVLFGFLALRGVGFGWGLAWLPAILLTHLAFCFGISCFISAVNVFFRDTEHLLSVVLMAWFFLTPVIYPVSLITDEMSLPPFLLYVYFANPMTGIISAYRSALLGYPFPFLKTAMLSFAIAWAALPLGIVFFQRMQIRFADEL